MHGWQAWHGMDVMHAWSERTFPNLERGHTEKERKRNRIRKSKKKVINVNMFFI
jgi:hypothetical protein